MNFNKRKRMIKRGLKMIESVTKNYDEEIAMEYRIEDQLRFNLGEEYYIESKKHSKNYKKI